MLKKTSKGLKTLFLLHFTKELIINSAPSDIFKLENLIKEETKEEFKPKKKLRIKKIIPITPRVLTIPQPRLPPALQHLRPTPTNVQIDLGKLNPLIKDPVVDSIDCNGPDEKILVRTPKIKKTNIILNKEEIDEIIQRFAQTAKIPIQEGIFKVAVGRLIITAIISSVIGSRFTIKKMMYYPGFRR